jgi:hypothetical protein
LCPTIDLKNTFGKEVEEAVFVSQYLIIVISDD